MLRLYKNFHLMATLLKTNWLISQNVVIKIYKDITIFLNKNKTHLQLQAFFRHCNLMTVEKKLCGSLTQ